MGLFAGFQQRLNQHGAKIDEFDFTVGGDHNVFGLYIPVHHVVALERTQRHNDLFNNTANAVE